MDRIPALEIVRRVPALLLAAVYVLVCSRRGDQVGALFEMLRFPRDQATLYVLAIVSGLGLALLVFRPGRVWRIIDGALFMTPLLALSFAFLRTPGESGTGTGTMALLAIAALVIGLVAFRLVDPLPAPDWRRAGAVAVAAFLVWLGIYLATLAAPVEFPRAAGTLLLGLAFFGLCAVVLQIALCRPVIGAPVLIAVAAAFFLNEQAHRLAIVDRTADLGPGGARDNSVRGDVTLKETFAAWLQSRSDLQAYRAAGLDYPVFIVTAEGGGGYAAAHSYLFLSKMQRLCPNFVQHVFAVVGVSGGAVGAAEFWRTLASDVNPETPQGCKGEARAREDVAFLSTDHLSPVVAALFYHDFANKILFGWLPGRDRSAALIASLTAETPLGDDGNPLYWDHYWRWEGDDGLRIGEAPVIIPVAANAISGKRYVFAPFRFSYPRCRFEEVIHDLNAANNDYFCLRPAEGEPESPSAAPSADAEAAGIEAKSVEAAADDHPKRALDVGLFDAAVASASFPYVTPSVLLRGWHDSSVALVDGGYLDNSGAETAREIVLELQDPVFYFDGFSERGVQGAASFAAHEAKIACENDPDFEPFGVARRMNDPRPEVPQICSSEGGLCEMRDAEDRAPPCGPSIALKTITIRAEPTEQRFAERQSFFLDPFHALVNGRSRRAETARRALLAQLCGGVDCPPQVESGNLPAIGFLDSVIEPELDDAAPRLVHAALPHRAARPCDRAGRDDYRLRRRQWHLRDHG